jgi:hypothetical protein
MKSRTVFAIGAASLALVSTAAAATQAPTSVTYTARVFMRGMKITVPAGWTVHEDHPGEFNLASPAGRLAETNIHFWLDPIPTAPHGVVLPTLGRTPSALIGWLRANDNFVVSTPTPRRVARGVAATSVDLDVAATAPREDPSCTNPCLTYFVFKGPGYHFGYGTGQDEPVRLYFATLHQGSATHTFTISVDTPSANAFKAMLPVAATILATVRLPQRISAG